MINAEKWFVTSGDIATVLVVMANVVDGADRLPTLFVVDRDQPGVEIVDDPDFTHSYPDRHPTIRFTNVEVGPEDYIGEIGGGDDLQRSWFSEERLGIAARGVGAMWRLLDETVDWATAREQGGERIYDYQGVSFPLADSAADAAAGRLLALQVAAMIDDGADPKLAHHKASMAKLFVSEAAWRCADRCVQAFGGRGYRALERRRAIPARAPRRPDLGGHQRDPAADHRQGPRAPGSGAHPPLVPDGAPHRPDPAPLLEPRSVAVVGATDRPGSYGDTVLTNLERAGFAGPVWGVHPTRTSVHGRDCVPSPAELPEPVDAVVFAIPAAKVPGSLAEAAERGCRGAIVFSAGFGEAPGGGSLERELAEVAGQAGIPLCGPNGNGVIAVAARAPLWGDSVPELRPGPVAMITQSGNLAVNAIGSRRGIDFHTLVSAGNQTVLDAADWLAAVAARDGVRSIALFLEEDGDGARLAEALALCAERGVGVVVLKVGESRAGAAAAAAHTGAVAGDQRAFRALVEEAGAAWVRDPHELLEVARVLAEPRARPGRSGGIAVLTCSGGDSGIAADLAQQEGIELPAAGG